MRRVFRNVASALKYLHQEPIIHSKLSDFGSANLVKYATTCTPGEGAIIYAALEAFPQLPTSPQTPKIDVYSYGVLLGEVTS